MKPRLKIRLLRHNPFKTGTSVWILTHFYKKYSNVVHYLDSHALVSVRDLQMKIFELRSTTYFYWYDIRYANPNLSLWHYFYLIERHSIEFYRLCILTKFEVNISHVYLKNTITNCITRAAMFLSTYFWCTIYRQKNTFNLPALLNIRFFVITCKNHLYI